MNQDISALRKEYTMATLDELNIHQNPIQQFSEWFNDAQHAQIDEPNAMALSTVDALGKPHSRIVLLKGLVDQKFQFYTNYQSNKGKEIATSHNICLHFFWKELQRQVRIEGWVQKMNEQDSTTYFQSRPKDSQIGAWASAQSEVLESRQGLEAQFEHFKNLFANSEPIPKPPFWGGYEVTPNYIEFWQGRANRLHDRLAFTLQNQQWTLSRLSP